ncbi:uncharacterized protein V6R79_000492 [Siganus canaliculatus]
MTSAVSGLVAFLLYLQVIQGSEVWGVTYRSTQICAVKGSTVEIKCTFWFPSTINDKKTTVEKTLWFTKINRNDHVELTSDPQYSGRVSQSCEDQSCTLTLRDVTESDSAHFHFRFITNQEGGRYTGKPGVTLTVTDIELQVQQKSSDSNYIWGKLMCQNNCLLPDHLSYIWSKNGERIPSQTSSSYQARFSPDDSFSCALEGHENFPSPSVLIQGSEVWGVFYRSTQICAVKGSTVEIKCSFWFPSTINDKKTTVEKTFWFTKMDGDDFVELISDPQYSGRVSQSCEDQSCTLTLRDLTESDSAHFQFRFITNQEGGRYTGNPGVTLTVTELQVQLVEKSSNYIWRRLMCQSSCLLPDHLSYIWYKNGKRIPIQTSYQTWFSPEDSVSCALKGHENFLSPSVFACWMKELCHLWLMLQPQVVCSMQPLKANVLFIMLSSKAISRKKRCSKASFSVSEFLW